MGNAKTISRLLAACFLCGAVIWMMERNPETIPAAYSGRLLSTNLREVDYVMLEKADESQIVFRREGGTRNWQIVRPSFAPAYDAVIKSMLDAFERAPCLDVIDEEEIALRGLSLSDFGMDAPRGRVVIKGPRFRVEMTMGALSTSPKEMFVAIGSSVFVTDSSLRRFCETPVEAFADRRVFRNDPRRANVVTINRGRQGFVKLVRDYDHRAWKITQPCRTRADWHSVEEFFDVLYSARIERYVDAPSLADVTSSGGTGLEGAEAVVVQIASPEDPVGQVATIGRPLPGGADQVYVRSGADGAVGVVTGEVRRVALKSVSDLRDKHLFRFSAPPVIRAFSIEAGAEAVAFRRSPDDVFAMTAPVSDQASPAAVSGLLDSMLALSATNFVTVDRSALAPGSLATLTVDASTGNYKFLLFPVPGEKPPGDGGKSFLVVPFDAVSGASGALPSSPAITVPVVPSSELSPLLAMAADPRPLLSRTVLKLDPKDILRVSSVRGGTTSVVERADNAWGAVAAPGEVVSSAVGTWLETVGGLDADRVEALSGTGRDDYSFSSPSQVISFDLRNGTSPRAVLILGARAPGGGVYARLQGHDVVFVLSDAVAGTFARPLVVPASSQQTREAPPPADLQPPPRK